MESAIAYNSSQRTPALPNLRFPVDDRGLVHGSHLKQKKFTDTKSLGITRPHLVRQPVNTPLICQIRGDITMSFRCDHAQKQLVHGFSSFHFDMAPRLRLGTISRGTWKP